MTKYLKYDHYQGTSHSHIGVIPSHWALKRTKYLFDRQNRPPRECDETVTAFRDGQVTLRTNRRTDGFTQSLKEIGYQGVRCGDLVVHAMDGFAGAIGVSDSDGKCTPVYNICQPVEGSTSSKYYGLYLRNLALNGYVESLAKGIRERSTEFRYAELKEVWLPEPPFEEQGTIVNFLDHETAKIDTLIDKQQQLIKLLQEKRQAVISHAVTKGLNPDAVMKDSGVEWLGEVPEHWDRIALKRLTSIPIIDGPHETPVKHDDGIPFVSAEAVGNGSVNFDKKWGYISKEDHVLFSKRYSPQRGDILVIKLGATTGVAAIVDTDEVFDIWVPLAAVRCNKKVLPHYVLHALRSTNVQDAIRLSWTYGTQQTLGLKTLGTIFIPTPPKEEQEAIVAYLEQLVPRFELLIRKAGNSIELLIERRTALISAAVTGKIDVRNWQPAQAEIPREASA